MKFKIAFCKFLVLTFNRRVWSLRLQTWYVRADVIRMKILIEYNDWRIAYLKAKIARLNSR